MGPARLGAWVAGRGLGGLRGGVGEASPPGTKVPLGRGLLQGLGWASWACRPLPSSCPARPPPHRAPPHDPQALAGAPLGSLKDRLLRAAFGQPPPRYNVSVTTSNSACLSPPSQAWGGGPPRGRPGAPGASSGCGAAGVRPWHWGGGRGGRLQRSAGQKERTLGTEPPPAPLRAPALRRALPPAPSPLPRRAARRGGGGALRR